MIEVEPDTLLADLDADQRAAVTITSGPLCILAGAGSGKTRVISRRVAWALATGVVRPRDILVVTFTEKAAGAMAGRLADLGHRGVTAATFHAAALRQLRHFWPRVHGTDAPEILASKAPILAPLAANLPGGYRYLAVRDLAAEIEWAKARRIPADAYEDRAVEIGRDAPLPADLMAGLYRRYEVAKRRAGRIDFEDMLELTIGLIESNTTVADEVRDRYRWFSVDEYQDTNPLQQALLDAWLGGRDDLAVVGDEDQTIYTFTGATSDYLVRFSARYPAARLVRLERNYRSTPEVLGFANRVLEAGRSAPDEREPDEPPRPPKRLVAILPGGPVPKVRGFPTADAEVAAIVTEVRALARDGVAHGAMAILVRTNAQLPAFEDALGGAGIAFHVRGERFFGRPEVRRAMRVAGALAGGRDSEGGTDVGLTDLLARAFGRELGVRRDAIPDGEAAAERHAAVMTLLEVAEDVVRDDPAAGVAEFVEEVQRRAAIEDGSSPSTEPRASSGRPSSCPHSRKGSCRSGRRPNPPSSPRNDGCSMWASPALDGTSGCRGPPHGPARPDARADERARGSSMASCRGPRSPGGRWRRMVAGRRPRRAPVDRRWTPPTGRRCRTRSVPGGRPVPGPIRSRPSSSSTTRRSRRSRRPDHARSPSSGVSRASARRSSTATARRSSES
jgi:DNA helicase-2/ATP-dependent DNA helicase PcrA